MAEVIQNSEVVAKVYDLTPNQLLILLHLKVHDRLPLTGKWADDLTILVSMGIIHLVDCGHLGWRYKLTELGENYINNILTLIIE